MSDDLYAVADFCLIPIGTGEPSVAEYIAECQRILQKSGLTYKVISKQKGPWSAVSKAIHDCHAAVHARGAPRVATDIRIGTRIDREISPGTGNDHKVRRVEEILEKDSASA
ncbi:YkoF-like protein [Mycena sanguinolenta]|nr:YkoF-like protein [Mycena sanguinolenta]